MDQQQSGTVKWYNPEKGYGFITGEDGQDRFVHRNAIADDRSWLVDGQGVAYITKQGLKGLEATDVRVVQDVEAIPPGRQRLYDQHRESAARYGTRSTDGYGVAARGFAPRQPREGYGGPLPDGPVPAEVRRIDPIGRFLFAHVESVGDDVYVNSHLFERLYLQQGDSVMVTLERSDRGLRARTLSQH